MREDRRNGRQFYAHTYTGDLGLGSHDGLGNRDWDVVIHELGPSAVEAEWLDRRGNEKPECGRFTLRPQAEPMAVYETVRELASVQRPTAQDARGLSEAAALLPPSGLLPTLDQQTDPRETHEAQVGFWDRYIEGVMERVEIAPLDMQADAEALATLTREAFPWDVAPARTIFEDWDYTAAVDDVLTRAGARILDAELSVPVLLDLSGDGFCTAAATMPLGTDRWNVLAGLPYRAWDRAVAEEMLVRLSDCSRLGPVQADRLVRDWPRIQEAAAREEAQAEAARTAEGARAELEAILAEAIAFEPTVENYLATNGFAAQDIEIDRTDMRAADIRGEYRLRMQALRAEVEPALQDWLAGQIDMSDEDLLADDWKTSALAIDKCGLTVPEGISDSTLSFSINQACATAIRGYEERRSELRCNARLEAWDDPEQLDLMLRVGTGPTALDMQDTSLAEFLCDFGDANDVAFEATGFFTTGYELTVTSLARPESGTTASFEVDEAGDLIPTEVEHSLGGDLSGLDVQARMRCLMRPTQRFCEAPPE
ncbi:hypothetical protein [Jannaschia aquimarina]|uniref:Uncharacterized protein n=1 Tax=Jannaschia aquimarina TaxID=935700 RepID=A0A0D1D6G0_9RHOB|nr:hypothetical protein [Jannaschia aquimarina]KIT15578.1 hypothetical protein jaqu_26750 [Jannaschia aquimarina]SNT27200.1 hypothetical protein SAMN05421775_109129 [Jannaschia aquimarina]